MKVASWAVAAALVYRQLGEAAFAVLVMTRATLGLLNYTTFGLGPALTKMVAEAEGKVLDAPVISDAPANTGTIDYRRPPPKEKPRPTVLPARSPESPAALLRSTRRILLVGGIVVLTLLSLYGQEFETLHDVPPMAIRADELMMFVVWLGIGMFLRLAGDAVGGATQAMGYVAGDQSHAVVGELIWIGLLVLAATGWDFYDLTLSYVGGTYFVSGFLIYIGRSHLAKQRTGMLKARPPLANKDATRRLLTYGGLVTLGSAADFLYAPIDYFLLNRLVDPLAPAVYAPAVQIDAAILVLVSAVATVALPKAAQLAAAGDVAGVRRSYLRGSLLAAGAATAIALPAWWFSPVVYELWLGDDLPATRAILPLVLVHTVLGSAAGVGRATLVAVGYAKQYALVVLLGGLLNVGLSYLFIRLGLGIEGVVLGTVISVGVRCLAVLPWLVWRATRAADATIR